MRSSGVSAFVGGVEGGKDKSFHSCTITSLWCFPCGCLLNRSFCSRGEFSVLQSFTKERDGGEVVTAAPPTGRLLTPSGLSWRTEHFENPIACWFNRTPAEFGLLLLFAQLLNVFVLMKKLKYQRFNRTEAAYLIQQDIKSSLRAVFRRQKKQFFEIPETT